MGLCRTVPVALRGCGVAYGPLEPDRTGMCCRGTVERIRSVSDSNRSAVSNPVASLRNLYQPLETDCAVARFGSVLVDSCGDLFQQIPNRSLPCSRGAAPR